MEQEDFLENVHPADKAELLRIALISGAHIGTVATAYFMGINRGAKMADSIYQDDQDEYTAAFGEKKA